MIVWVKTQAIKIYLFINTNIPALYKLVYSPSKNNKAMNILDKNFSLDTKVVKSVVKKVGNNQQRNGKDKNSYSI